MAIAVTRPQWPCHRSPDLSPLDFFVWPHLKSLVYQPDNLLQSPEDIITELHAATTTIDVPILGCVQGACITYSKK
ncbi:hypothetical protein PR048_001922 [Dryococelus australis]|uniref:Uncharacterized protein n=1 Tax=Dryococelus australis TaxID=614101 RepID=A0ABQ9IIQ6_9NEOP|nr:hypothetical protein PR048_001922 [Dryococelus australis]